MTSACRWPIHGWIGLGLVILFWTLNWTLPGLRTQWAFFPLWLGYCLTVDALVFYRKGESMLKRNPWAYIRLFIISALGWWLFELFNLRLMNWFYDGREFFTDMQYAALASLSFCTVMPSVFGTAELIGTLKWIRRLGRGPIISQSLSTLVGFFIAGWIMLALLLIWPKYFFYLVWISVYFIIEPINVVLKNRSLSKYTAEGNWRPIVSLWIGCLICGFFWEMWNFYSYPKWVYQVPLVNFLHVFEMPLLGYSGYIPFSMELFALYHFVAGLFRLEEGRDFIHISD